MADNQRYDKLLAQVKSVREQVNAEGMRPIPEPATNQWIAGYGAGLTFALDLIEMVILNEERAAT